MVLSMDICSEGHAEIVFMENPMGCPMCKLEEMKRDEVETLRDVVQSLKEDIRQLEDDIEELEEELEDVRKEQQA